MGIYEPSFQKNISQTVIFIFCSMVKIHTWSLSMWGKKRIRVTLVSQSGPIRAQWCCIIVRQNWNVSPTWRRKKLLSWGNYNSVLEKCLLSCCFEIPEIFLLWSDANNGKSPVKVNTTMTKISERKLWNKNWGQNLIYSYCLVQCQMTISQKGNFIDIPVSIVL